MSWLSHLKRALIVGICFSQAACSVCATRSQETLDKSMLAADGTPEVAARPISTRPRIVERIVLSLRDGTKHNAILSFPANIQTPLPTIIILGGFNTGEKALDFVRKDLDVIYATTDYPYKAPNKRGFVKDMSQFAAIRTAISRTDFAVDALIEKLQSDPRVDANKMTFVGASFGAPFALTAAVRNPQLDGLILLYAFGRVDLAIARQLVNKWGCWSCPFAWFVGQLAWAYLGYDAPETQVPKLLPSQHVLYMYSDTDEQIPSASVDSLRRALGHSPAQVTFVKTEGGHIAPDKIEMLRGLMDVSTEWLKAQNLF